MKSRYNDDQKSRNITLTESNDLEMTVSYYKTGSLKTRVSMDTEMKTKRLNDTACNDYV